MRASSHMLQAAVCLLGGGKTNPKRVHHAAVIFLPSFRSPLEPRHSWTGFDLHLSGKAPSFFRRGNTHRKPILRVAVSFFTYLLEPIGAHVFPVRASNRISNMGIIF